ncbi:hypothetical protein BHM03_00053125 [Ensete ventricosum]|nr:hypothetical protein BHM03_00053125 [Ensete ventricosum]
MIDIGSFTDILYLDTFQKLGFSVNNLTPMTSSLTGFTSDYISSLGTMILNVTFDDQPCNKTVMTKFLVVDIPLVYHMIIAQLTLNRLRASVDLSHDNEVPNKNRHQGAEMRYEGVSPALYNDISLSKKVRPKAPLLDTRDFAKPVP